MEKPNDFNRDPFSSLGQEAAPIDFNLGKEAEPIGQQLTESEMEREEAEQIRQEREERDRTERHQETQRQQFIKRARKSPELWDEAMKIAELEYPVPEGISAGLEAKYHRAQKRAAEEYLERATFQTTRREDQAAKAVENDKERSEHKESLVEVRERLMKEAGIDPARITPEQQTDIFKRARELYAKGDNLITKKEKLEFDREQADKKRGEIVLRKLANMPHDKAVRLWPEAAPVLDEIKRLRDQMRGLDKSDPSRTAIQQEIQDLLGRLPADIDLAALGEKLVKRQTEITTGSEQYKKLDKAKQEDLLEKDLAPFQFRRPDQPTFKERGAEGQKKLEEINLKDEEAKNSAAFREIKRQLMEIGRQVAEARISKDTVQEAQDKLIEKTEQENAAKWEEYVKEVATAFRTYRGNAKLPLLPHWSGWGKVELAVFDYFNGHVIRRMSELSGIKSKAKMRKSLPSTEEKRFEKALNPESPKEGGKDQRLIISGVTWLAEHANPRYGRYQVMVDIYNNGVLSQDAAEKHRTIQQDHMLDRLDDATADKLLAGGPDAQEAMAKLTDGVEGLIKKHLFLLEDAGLTLSEAAIKSRTEQVVADILVGLKQARKSYRDWQSKQSAA